MFGFRKKKHNQEPDQLAVVTEFSLAIRNRIMSQINQQITDMKEVIQASVTQAIVEEISLNEIANIENNSEGAAALNLLKQRLSYRIESIVTQQAVAMMDRLSRAGSASK